MANVWTIVLLIAVAVAMLEAYAHREAQQKFRRQKREWIIPPRKLKENVNYMNLEYIAKIRSDEETRTTIRYSLTGPGADQDPANLFTVDSEKGLVKIHGVLDRERTPFYYLWGMAKFLNGSFAEKDINLKIVVLDENDCAPVFKTQMSGAVPELSDRDTFVMTVTATDADEEGTLHSKIAYSIAEESQTSIFYINRESGGIYVKQNTLDRERQDTYTLTIKGTDMNGGRDGNTGMGKVVISILDVNDNIPILEKSFYQCSVKENIRNVEILRIKAIDADLIHTDNWLAVFSIVSGNEAGFFSITTDVNTNEGILMLNKELDYEELKELKLQVSVSNKAEYHSSVVITETKTYSIIINVVNQPEGPRFKPAIKVISLSEDSTSIDLRKIITNYAAIDSDTMLIAKNVRYAKGQDIDNWLLIDEQTADIRLNKMPDFESKFLINRTYYSQIICITNDYPAMTATGTIAIQVEDFNDHCPVLTTRSQSLCYGNQVVYVTALDRDYYPNGAPFEFKVVTQSTKESWSVTHLNDTTAVFRSHETLWPGLYNLYVEVRDQQGKFCADQVVQINVCTCDAEKVCLPKSFTFGAAGVLLMLLGLLLLLLAPLLLLFCLCGGARIVEDFKTIPYDVKEHLIMYNTEGPGEDKDVPVLQIPKEVDDITFNKVGALGKAPKNSERTDGVEGAAGAHQSLSYKYHQHVKTYYHHSLHSDGDYKLTQTKDKHMHTRFHGSSTYEGLALSDDFLQKYYSQKATCFVKKHNTGDSLQIYDYEGQESCIGSLEDICSFIHEEESLAFLDDLGPKFKALAEICCDSTMETIIPVTSKPVTSKTSTTVDVHTTAAQQTSSLSSKELSIHEKVVIPDKTLLIQQPALYYAPATPVYVVDHQPALLVTAGPVLGLKESLLIEEQMGSDLTLHGTSKHEMRHSQSVFLVEKQRMKGGILAEVQAQSSVSGAAQIVGTKNVQSSEVDDVLSSASRMMPVEAKVRKSVGNICGSLVMGAPQNL